MTKKSRRLMIRPVATKARGEPSSQLVSGA